MVGRPRANEFAQGVALIEVLGENALTVRDAPFLGGRTAERDKTQSMCRMAEAAVCFSGERVSIEIIER